MPVRGSPRITGPHPRRWNGSRQQPLDVIHDQIGGRHQHQRDDGGEQHPERQGDGHRLQEIGLRALFQQQRRQSRERGDRGQQNRPQPRRPRFLHRRWQGAAPPALAVDEVDQHEAVVDHDARQGHDAHHRQHRHVLVHRDVPADGPDEPEGDGAHDDERLHVGPEGNRQQREDREQRERKPHLQAADHGILNPPATLRRSSARRHGPGPRRA